MFPVIGGMYYWFPKMTGRMLDERLGEMVLGDVRRLQPRLPADAPDRAAGHAAAHLHLSPRDGLGRPEPAHHARRIPARARRAAAVDQRPREPARGAVAGPNPWDAPTLEWSIPSPPPPYNFAVIPHVASRHPLWEGRLEESDERYSSLERAWCWTTAARRSAQRRSTASRTSSCEMPEDSYRALLARARSSAFFVGLLLHLWWLALVGAACVALALLIWLWPERQLRQRVATQHV